MLKFSDGDYFKSLYESIKKISIKNLCMVFLALEQSLDMIISMKFYSLFNLRKYVKRRSEVNLFSVRLSLLYLHYTIYEEESMVEFFRF